MIKFPNIHYEMFCFDKKKTKIRKVGNKDMKKILMIEKLIKQNLFGGSVCNDPPRYSV